VFLGRNGVQCFMRMHALGLALIVWAAFTPDNVVRCTFYALTYRIALRGTQC
jgi:hypothetical protein